nr:SUMF1/EgtB/PvdO family nonheme iron enzyme [Noviherbaspirillum aerium]
MVTAAERDGGGFEWGAGWERRRGWTYLVPFGKPGADNEPAVHLAWAEAEAYCKWAGGFLPGKQEWQLAAYTEKRPSPPKPFEHGRTYPYPTGENPDGANVSRDGDGWARHAPVGSTRAGVNGLFDAGGNVWEWLADANGEERLTAGGSWWYDSSKMKMDGMQYKPAKFYAVYVGFRCAYKN